MEADRKNNGVIRKLLIEYIRLLKERPVITKACTSATTAALGSLISQLTSSQSLNYGTVLAYGSVGMLYVGPLIHYFYQWMENISPKSSQYSAITRVVLDRLIFAPPFLFGYFYLLSIFEGKDSATAMQKIREMFWPILKTNIKVWTLFQYVNVNYVPLEFRPLFSSVLSLVWNIYVATMRR